MSDLSLIFVYSVFYVINFLYIILDRFIVDQSLEARAQFLPYFFVKSKYDEMSVSIILHKNTDNYTRILASATKFICRGVYSQVLYCSDIVVI